MHNGDWQLFMHYGTVAIDNFCLDFCNWKLLHTEDNFIYIDCNYARKIIAVP